MKKCICKHFKSVFNINLGLCYQGHLVLNDILHFIFNSIQHNVLSMQMGKAGYGKKEADVQQ